MSYRPRTTPSNFRLTDEARELLSDIAQRNGLSMTAMLEVMIRQEADRLPKSVKITTISPPAQEPRVIRVVRESGDGLTSGWRPKKRTA